MAEGGRETLRCLLLILLLFGCARLLATEHRLPPDSGQYLDNMLPPIIAAPLAPKPAELVLIIDDLGYGLRPGEAVMDLPGKLNVAVLPYTPHGQRLARLAHASGKEVLLHAPMSNLSQVPLDRGALTLDMSEPELRQMLASAIGQVPHVRGISNHMGSELTRCPRQMGWVMQELLDRGLYFVDSRTSSETIAATSAAEHGVPHLSRHVFLDNERDPELIHRNFELLVSKARDQGLAVGIGHPYPETIDYLRGALPALQRSGVRLVYASEAAAGSATVNVARTEAGASQSLTSMPRSAM